MLIQRFNIRVYGILKWNGAILLVKEQIGNFSFTKFPGGGLEFGEGIKDCLIREFKEETGMEVVIGKHLYTTDFFQQSAFHPSDQLIAVYYEVLAVSDPAAIRLDEFDIENDGKVEQLQFVWVPLETLHEDMVTFPIDKRVVDMIKEKV